MLTYLWIMLGGALGSGARFWAAELIGDRFADPFPLGILFVNVSGSFLIGFLAAFAEPGSPLLLGPRARQFLLIGVLGGYTTFSTFSLQTLELARAGDWWRAGWNSLLSLAFCLVAVWLGRTLGLLFASR